jgi:hypothetical protein
MTRNSILKVSIFGSKVGRNVRFMRNKMYSELEMKNNFMIVL